MQNPKKDQNKPESGDFVAVLGAKGSGKTLFITALLASIVDGKADKLTGTVSQQTQDFLNRQLLPMRQHRQWPNPTRGWHNLGVSLRSQEEEKIKDFSLSFQDIQGSDFETFSPALIEKMEKAKAYFFIVSPKHLLTAEELEKAAGSNAYLECIIPEEERFSRQINWNYAKALEELSKTAGFQKDLSKKKSVRPISVIFTRKDDYPHLDIEVLKKKFEGTFKWFQAHAKYVNYFFASSVGKTVDPDPEQDEKIKQLFREQYGQNINLKLPAKKSPPIEIDPEGVVDPLKFVLSAFVEEKEIQIQRRIRIGSIAAAIILGLIVTQFTFSWSQKAYHHWQMREQRSMAIHRYIQENPEQIQEIYKKIQTYFQEYGKSHSEGQKLLGVHKSLFSKVQEEWLDELILQAQEVDQGGKSSSEYQRVALIIKTYLDSEFPKGKSRLRDFYERIEQRKELALALEEAQDFEKQGNYRHAIAILGKYEKKHDFQKTFVEVQRKKWQKNYSQILYQKAMENLIPLRSSENLGKAILSLESFDKKEDLYLDNEEKQKIRDEILQLRFKKSIEESERAFQQRNYTQAYRILKIFAETPTLPENIKNQIQEKLEKLSGEEYQEELRFSSLVKGKEALENLYQFQNKYFNHPSYKRENVLHRVSFALEEMAQKPEDMISWQEKISLFELQEQRFPQILGQAQYWGAFVPLLETKLNEFLDQKNYESSWNLLKTYQIKISNQAHLKKTIESLQNWGKNLAQAQLENDWQKILHQKSEIALNSLDKFRQYQNQPFFAEIYRSQYLDKVEEKRFQVCLQQYETTLQENDFSQARLVLETYETWGSEDYRGRVSEMEEQIDKQEIHHLWQPYLVKANDSFLSIPQKLESLEQFQRSYRERSGYGYVEEDVEIHIRILSNKLQDEDKNKLTRQIARAFEDETALLKAKEFFESYQKNYPADPNISEFQAQIHEVQNNWVRKHLQSSEEIFDHAKRYEAYEGFIRKYTPHKYLYKDLLEKAEKLKEETALEWDKQEFLKADSIWREFRYRADEFSPADGRKRLQEMVELYQNYTKHWGPEKKYLQDAREQALLINQLLHGANYTLELIDGSFASNYWVMNPTVEVLLRVGRLEYPFKLHPNKRNIVWREKKEVFWKAYEPVQLVVRDKDKSNDQNVLLTHSSIGFFGLFKLCTTGKQEREFQSKRIIMDSYNKISFSLVSSSSSVINRWYGLKSSKADESKNN